MMRFWSMLPPVRMGAEDDTGTPTAGARPMLPAQPGGKPLEPTHTSRKALASHSTSQHLDRPPIPSCLTPQELPHFDVLAAGRTQRTS